MRMSRTLSIAVLTLISGAVFTGCGSGGPSTEGSAATSAASDPTPSESSGIDVPADWQAVSVKAAQLSVPSDWELSSNADLSQVMTAPKDDVGISPGAGHIQANVYSTDVTAADLEELARLTEKDLEKDFTNLKRLPNETINGQVFFHFRGDDKHVWYDEYVTLEPSGQYQISIFWNFYKTDTDRKGAEELIAQIMPTYEVP